MQLLFNVFAHYELLLGVAAQLELDELFVGRRHALVQLELEQEPLVRQVAAQQLAKDELARAHVHSRHKLLASFFIAAAVDAVVLLFELVAELLERLEAIVTQQVERSMHHLVHLLVELALALQTRQLRDNILAALLLLCHGRFGLAVLGQLAEQQLDALRLQVQNDLLLGRVEQTRRPCLMLRRRAEKIDCCCWCCWLLLLFGLSLLSGGGGVCGLLLRGGGGGQTGRLFALEASRVEDAREKHGLFGGRC